ncbi:hypothetical protein BJF93_05370 [Xaviernesmea oryzae]|uniref:DUF1476 domain-containing protein n=1 Tax=Xaviernesmea oryzae TaxID=464029 RepID=A0A1Q9ARL6_9HYPH|nr:DUF1476 domain-containing protein [Xaviernesmea oryzae]OLP58067.1 hypothetical protein BJF93_05370 [Xaviernesmea oryzae]SEL83820.1 hypothetical protein SAMN04487976_113132 [Xaviernesmea oryzae]
MTALKKRARALEDKFAHDQEFLFKAEARRNALLGLWAAAEMNRQDADAYAKEVATAHVEHPDGAFARVREDLTASGVQIDDNELRNRMVVMLRDVAREMYDGR